MARKSRLGSDPLAAPELNKSLDKPLEKPKGTPRKKQSVKKESPVSGLDALIKDPNPKAVKAAGGKRAKTKPSPPSKTAIKTKSKAPAKTKAPAKAKAASKKTHTSAAKKAVKPPMTPPAVTLKAKGKATAPSSTALLPPDTPRPMPKPAPPQREGTLDSKAQKTQTSETAPTAPADKPDKAKIPALPAPEVQSNAEAPVQPRQTEKTPAPKVSATQDDLQDTKSAQYLSFTLGSELCMFEIAHVKEVLGYSKVTRVPNAPAYMSGVINLRGSVVPVVDLKLMLGGKAAEQTIDTSIVIFDTQEKDDHHLLGLVVDSVREVIDLKSESIQPPPKIGGQLNVQYLKGIGEAGDQMFLIFDILNILYSGDFIKTTA